MSREDDIRAERDWLIGACANVEDVPAQALLAYASEFLQRALKGSRVEMNQYSSVAMHLMQAATSIKSAEKLLNKMLRETEEALPRAPAEDKPDDLCPPLDRS